MSFVLVLLLALCISLPEFDVFIFPLGEYASLPHTQTFMSIEVSFDVYSDDSSNDSINDNSHDRK